MIEQQRRIRNYQGVEIHSATSMRTVTCGHAGCPNAHLIGFDEKGLPFCEIVASADMLRHALAIASRDLLGASVISIPIKRKE
jgi:hypothetical protein